MANTAAADPNHFTSRIVVNGDKVTNPAPKFSVDDTGTPGATATLSGPTGVHEIPEDDIEVFTHPKFGPRVGFQCPELTVAGDYSLTVDQDGVITVYTIDVVVKDITPTPSTEA